MKKLKSILIVSLVFVAVFVSVVTLDLSVKAQTMLYEDFEHYNYYGWTETELSGTCAVDNASALAGDYGFNSTAGGNPYRAYLTGGTFPDGGTTVTYLDFSFLVVFDELNIYQYGAGFAGRFFTLANSSSPVYMPYDFRLMRNATDTYFELAYSDGTTTTYMNYSVVNVGDLYNITGQCSIGASGFSSLTINGTLQGNYTVNNSPFANIYYYALGWNGVNEGAINKARIDELRIKDSYSDETPTVGNYLLTESWEYPNASLEHPEDWWHNDYPAESDAANITDAWAYNGTQSLLVTGQESFRNKDILNFYGANTTYLCFYVRVPYFTFNEGVDNLEGFAELRNDTSGNLNTGPNIFAMPCVRWNGSHAVFALADFNMTFGFHGIRSFADTTIEMLANTTYKVVVSYDHNATHNSLKMWIGDVYGGILENLDGFNFVFSNLYIGHVKANGGTNPIYIDAVSVSYTYPVDSPYEEPEPTNNAPTIQTATISNMDDTDNLYSKLRAYNFLATFNDTDGISDLDFGQIAFNDGANWCNVTVDLQSNTGAVASGSTVFTLGTITNVTAGTGGTWTIPITLQWDIGEALDIELYAWVNDTANANATWYTMQTDYFDTENDLVTTFSFDDDRGNVAQNITASGTVTYEASALYPPNSEFTSVSVYDSANNNEGSDLTIINGAYSITFTTPATVGNDTYNLYVNMTDSDYTDAELTTPTDTFITDVVMLFLSIDDNRINISSLISANLNATYAYDGTDITDGTITLNGTAMTHKSGSWWQLNITQATVGQWTYCVDSVSGNAYDVTTMGIINLDGTNDKFTIPDSADFAWTSGFTIACWVKPTAVDATGYFVWQYDITTQDGYALYQSDTGTGKWVFETWVNGNNSVIYSNTIPTTDWLHIVCMREADGTMKMYLNGVLQTETNTNVGTIDSTANITIGAYPYYAGDYDGLLTEHRFYNRSLQLAEIYQLYQGRQTNNTGLVGLYSRISYDMYDALWRDISGNGNNGIIANVTVIAGLSTDETVRPIWDRLQVQSYTVSNSTPALGEYVTIDALIWFDYDNTVCTTGTITINGYAATYQGAGVYRLNLTSAVYASVIYNAVASNDETLFGVTTLDQNGQSTTVTWGTAPTPTPTTTTALLDQNTVLYMGLFFLALVMFLLAIYRKTLVTALLSTVLWFALSFAVWIFGDSTSGLTQGSGFMFTGLGFIMLIISIYFAFEMLKKAAAEKQRKMVEGDVL